MTTHVHGLAPAPRRARLPREHGFWTMLSASVFVAVTSSGPTPAVLLVAGAAVALAVASGATFGGSIRRHGAQQVAAAGALSLVNIPIALAGGAQLASIALDTLALAVVFTSSALCVRASFARATRSRRAHAAWLQRAAEALPCLALIPFVTAGSSAHVGVALLTLVACVVLGIVEPGVKRMKRVGLFLAGVTAIASIALGFF